MVFEAPPFETACQTLVECIEHNAHLLKCRLLVQLELPTTTTEQHSVKLGAGTKTTTTTTTSHTTPAQHDHHQQGVVDSQRAAVLHQRLAVAKDMFRAILATSQSAPTSTNVAAGISDVVIAECDSVFRGVYEEMALRLSEYHDVLDKKFGHAKTLNLALEAQREKFETTVKKNRELEEDIQFLKAIAENHVHILKRRDYAHKERLNAFLREIALLKEQLYRTYRDSAYVAIPVDLMPPIPDESSADDVDVDMLLQYRHMIKQFEGQISTLKLQIQALEREVNDKEQTIGMMNERSRGRN